MNARRFEIWVETQLAPELKPGDIVILDNVGFHKSERAAELVRKCGAWLLFRCSRHTRPIVYGTMQGKTAYYSDILTRLPNVCRPIG